MDYFFICFCCAVRCCTMHIAVALLICLLSFLFSLLEIFHFNCFRNCKWNRNEWMLGNFAICFSSNWKVLDKLRPNGMEKWSYTRWISAFNNSGIAHVMNDVVLNQIYSIQNWMQFQPVIFFFIFFYFIKYLCTQWIRRKHLSGLLPTFVSFFFK